MKKIILYFVSIGFIISCSNDNNEDPKEIVPEIVEEAKLPAAITHHGKQIWPDFEDPSLIRFYYTDNKLDSIIHENGVVTHVTYSGDKIIRMDHRYLSFSHTYHEFEYDSDNRLIHFLFFESEFYKWFSDFEYNADGSILEKKTYVTGPNYSELSEITHSYDSNGNLIRSVEPRGNGSSALETVYNYDSGKSPFINMVGMKYFKNLINMHEFGLTEDGGVNNMVRMNHGFVDLNTGEENQRHIENYINTYDDDGYLIKRDGDYMENNSYFFYNK